MDFIFGAALILTLMSTSWSKPVMVNNSTKTLQGNFRERIQDASDVDIFTRISEINKDIGASKTYVEYGDIATRSSKNALHCFHGPKLCLWPRSHGGIVYIPYTIDRAFSKSQQTIIHKAMKEFEILTCLKFIYRWHQRKYVKIISGTGCWSNIGFNRRVQIISLQKNGCVSHGIVQHELLHTIGFNHEQNRSDRDKYVNIIVKNIAEEAIYNFIKLNTNNLGTSYDYTSVMHYGRYAFSKDGFSSTIIPIPNPNIDIGQRYGMSALDVYKINKLYNCKKCGALLMMNHGLLNSPGFPKLYPNNLHCIWLIRTPDYKNKVSNSTTKYCQLLVGEIKWNVIMFFKYDFICIGIYLQFTTFQVEQFINCFSDHIVIYDGNNLLSPVLDGPNCGAENTAVVSSGPSLLVEFFSSPSQRAFGFSANFQFVECGDTLTRKRGHIDFRAWKKDNSVTRCWWAVLVPRSFKIVFKLSKVHLSKSENCTKDYLAIHNAAASPPTLFGKYCGNIFEPIIFTTTGRTLVLELSHLVSNLGWGFSAEYKSIINKYPPQVTTYRSAGSYQNTVALVPHILLTYAVLYFCIFLNC
ncbi:astacin-like metalloendopeptidase [Narcine bancroftii]|uniref:astacin-like metalloendopeptidase n=1 Tax=Narcine bancroftii TaxID=1343680 RepID=UPI003831AFA3